MIGTWFDSVSHFEGKGGIAVKVTELRKEWEGRRATLRKLVEGIPEGREDYCPAPGVMSLAGHALHILSAEKTAIDAMTVTPGKWEWATGIDAAHYPKREDVLGVLDRQSEVTRAYFDSLTDDMLTSPIKLPWGAEPTVEVFWLQWLTHDAHHCGNIITTMRAGGIEPPNVWG